VKTKDRPKREAKKLPNPEKRKFVPQRDCHNCGKNMTGSSMWVAMSLRGIVYCCSKDCVEVLDFD